jgi:hypothetical protein
VYFPLYYQPNPTLYLDPGAPERGPRRASGLAFPIAGARGPFRRQDRSCRPSLGSPESAALPCPVVVTRGSP